MLCSRSLRDEQILAQLRFDRRSDAHYGAGGQPGEMRTWLPLRLVYVNYKSGQQNSMFCYSDEIVPHPKVDFPGPKLPLTPAFRAKLITTMDSFIDMLPRLTNLPATNALNTVHAEVFFDEADIRTFSMELSIFPD